MNSTLRSVVPLAMLVSANESSCLLHIYAQFYKVCFHWNLDRKQVLKPGGALQPTYLVFGFSAL